MKQLLLIAILVFAGCNKKVKAPLVVWTKVAEEKPALVDSEIIFGEHLDGVELIEKKPEITPYSLTLYFKFNSHALTERAKDKLNAIPEGVGELYLYGHTCEIGTQEYNINLGLRRAMSVFRYLPNFICNPQSRGEMEPTSKTHELNRRVYISNVPQ